MGGAATVLDRDTNIPQEIRDKYDRNLELKKKIAEKDARYLRHHLMQTWKPHKDIIQLLTERTRYQLELVTYIFSRSTEIGGYSESLADSLNALGEVYGQFLKLLVTREFAIDTEMLDSVLASIGCDETVVADVVGVCTDIELHAVLAYHKQWKDTSLASRITKKTIYGSPFQKVILKMIDTGHRSTVVDSDIAAEQAQKLYGSGLGNLEVEKVDDEIFEILCLASREQCGLINELYEGLYDMSLQQAIAGSYRGSVSRALILWTASTQVHAVAKRFRFVLEDRVVDKVNLVHLVAKYDRHIMIDIMNMYDNLYSEDLEVRLLGKVTGNLRLAIEGWLDNHTCDRDHENAIRELMIQYETDISLLGNEEFMAKLHFHFDGEQSVLLKYMDEHKIDAVCTHTAPRSTHKELSDKDKQMMRIVSVKLVKRFLLDRLWQEDLDGSGSLDPTEFWTALSHMDLGYSDQEIEEMRNWVDADKDGNIIYSEVATELANSIVDTIEDRLGMDVATKVTQMRERCNAIDAELLAEWNALHGGDAAEAAEREGTEEISPNIVQHLRDTFDEVDVDKSGSLDAAEFWNILASVLQLTEGDKHILEMEWDDNKDGLISWTEALDEFNKIFLTMKNDHRDHWIGLVDKPSGKLFWYNLKDDTSFWMSEAEQQRFQNLKAQGANREEKLEPSHIPVLSDGSSGKKKSARDIKLLMKSEQEARTASAHGVAPSIAPA